MSLLIRPYCVADVAAISEITYRTGFKGEGLEGRDYVNDRRLWFLIFMYYYTKFEPQHFFVAEDVENRQVVGFICGSPDSAAQDNRFMRTMVWRIALRAFGVTLWRYPHTFINLVKMGRMLGQIQAHDNTVLYREFPAHLHINLLPDYQRRGLGGRLIRHFEEHMARAGACSGRGRGPRTCRGRFSSADAPTSTSRARGARASRGRGSALA